MERIRFEEDQMRVSKPMNGLTTVAMIAAFCCLTTTAAFADKKTENTVKGAVIGAGVGALVGDSKTAAAGAVVGAIIGANK